MKIIYFSQFYTPESIAPAFRATDNSRIWARNGNEVTVFTGYPNYPQGKIFDGYKVKLMSEERIAGVRVLRSKLIAVPNTTIFKRLENSLSFFFYGLVNILFFNPKRIGKDYDVVLGTSGVTFTALLAWVFAIIHKIPFVLELRDITYLQLQATGKSSKSFSVRGMRALELFLCRKAKGVVVVTSGFKKILIEDGIEEKKIEVITNGVDINCELSQNEDTKLTLSYFGTLGLSQGITNTFEYARIISESCENFEYLIIGEGPQKQEIQELATDSKYSFVRIEQGMSADALEPYYGKTALSVITLRKSENFRYTVPSKLFQVMGRGIAVLFIGPDGETADIIRKYDTGIALTGIQDEDYNALKCFFSNPDWRNKLLAMGKNGQKAVSEYYSREKLALKYLQILNSVLTHN